MVIIRKPAIEIILHHVFVYWNAIRVIYYTVLCGCGVRECPGVGFLSGKYAYIPRNVVDLISSFPFGVFSSLWVFRIIKNRVNGMQNACLAHISFQVASKPCAGAIERKKRIIFRTGLPN